MCVCVLFLQGVHLRDNVCVAEAILLLKVNDLIVNHVTSSSMTPLLLLSPSAFIQSVICTVAVNTYELVCLGPGCL